MAAISETINKLRTKKRTDTHIGIVVNSAHHRKEKEMIKSDNGKVMIEGNGITLLAELSCVVSALKSSGIPEEALRQCFMLGLQEKSEEEELADNFMRELMTRVMEKRNAQADKGIGDQ